MDIIYGKLPEKKYWQEHKKFTKQGLDIPNGSIVVPTEWAFQNGVSRRMERNKYIKVRDCIRQDEMIVVKKEGNKQGDIYWAGFWKIK